MGECWNGPFILYSNYEKGSGNLFEFFIYFYIFIAIQQHFHLIPRYLLDEYLTWIYILWQEFRTASLTDSSASVIKDAIAQLTNGVTLLATTAPALAVIMEQAINHINFDRCCHLVYEDADALIQEHPDVMKKILVMYRKSVKRTESCTDAKIFVPRQVSLEIFSIHSFNMLLMFFFTVIRNCNRYNILNALLWNISHLPKPRFY